MQSLAVIAVELLNNVKINLIEREAIFRDSSEDYFFSIY